MNVGNRWCSGSIKRVAPRPFGHVISQREEVQRDGPVASAPDEQPSLVLGISFAAASV